MVTAGPGDDHARGPGAEHLSPRQNLGALRTRTVNRGPPSVRAEGPSPGANCLGATRPHARLGLALPVDAR